MAKKSISPEMGVNKSEQGNLLGLPKFPNAYTVKTICVGRNSILKGCNIETNDCTHCRPDYLSKVERKTRYEQVELAGQTFDHIISLQGIIAEMQKLSVSSNPGKVTRKKLSDLYMLTAKLAFSMICTGSTLYSNMLFDDTRDKEPEMKSSNNDEFATEVVKEMNDFMDATGKCIEIIDASLDSKDYKFALNASRELLDCINGSSFLLFVKAIARCKTVTKDMN